MNTTTSTGLPERKAMIRDLLQSDYAPVNQDLDALQNCLKMAIGIHKDAKAKLAEAEQRFERVLVSNRKLCDAIRTALTADELVGAALLLAALADAQEVAP